MQQAIQENTEIDEKKLKTLPIIDPHNPSRKFSEKEEKWMREMRVYEFSNLEEPGLMQSFTYGKAGKSMNFTLFHGGKYRLPRFIAHHLESKGTPIYKWRPDGSGEMRKERTGTKSRFQLREVFLMGCVGR